MAQKRDFPDKLNICLVAKQFPLLGRASSHGFLWPLARALALQGHQVTILSWNNPDRQSAVEQDGVKAYFLGDEQKSSAFDFARLALNKFQELHLKKPFHVVHSLDRGGIEIGLKRQKLGVAMVYDIEATQMSQIFAVLGMSQETIGSLLTAAINVTYKFLTTYIKQDRVLLKTADAMFVTSPIQQMALERYYLYPEYRTHVVPYGIEIGDLSPRERSDSLRQKLNIPDNSPIVVTVSDMNSLEEIRPILKAFSRLAIKRSNARLIAIGNGPLFFAIEGETLELALGSKTLFLGTVPIQTLPDYIALADIFVNLSARTSGFEPSILEAMAQKKIVIGSEVSPIATLVEDGLDGFLIRPADAPALSELMQNIFNDEIDRQAIGERARAKVIQLFDLNRMVQSTLQAYAQALNNSGSFRKRRSAPWVSP